MTTKYSDKVNSLSLLIANSRYQSNNAVINYLTSLSKNKRRRLIELFWNEFFLGEYVAGDPAVEIERDEWITKNHWYSVARWISNTCWEI